MVSPETLKAKAFLYQPNPAVRWRTEPARGSMYGMGARRFVGQNPLPGAQIYYSLTKKAEKISLKVVDIGGKTVRELSASSQPGLHKVGWDLRGATTTPPAGPVARRQGLGGFGGGPAVQPGLYRVVLNVDGEELAQSVRVEADPTTPATLISSGEEKE